MTTIAYIGLAALVTATMATVDFAHARYSLAMQDHRRRVLESGLYVPRWLMVRDWRHWRGPLHIAARWSLVQWGAATVGFVLAVRVTMWLLPFEGLGLWIGTLLGGTRSDSSRVDQA
jgi:hypothetical protein